MSSPLSPFPLEHPAMEVILALVAGDGKNTPVQSGTAVFIAPGVALTASHVIDDFWDRFGGGASNRGSSHPSFYIEAFQYLPDTDSYVVWEVREDRSTPSLDIALLHLTPKRGHPAGYSWPYVTLDVSPPQLNDELFLVGVPANAPEWTGGGWMVSGHPFVSRGVVTQVFPKERDRVRLNFPSFELSVEAIGGMSGSPIFDRKGHVRGILCSSIEFGAPTLPVAYASTLWPTAGLRVSPTQNLGITEELPLLELGRRGIVRMVNHEDMRISGHDDR